MPHWLYEINRWFQRIVISNWWTVAFFLVLTLLILVWCWRRRRKGKRWYLWPLPLTVITLMTAGAAAINMHFGLYNTLGDLFDDYPFPTGSPSLLTNPTGNHPIGVTIPTVIPGTTSGVGERAAFIWLPPQYFTNPADKFPVVYLYPGSPGDHTMWFTGGNAWRTGATAAAAGLPAIIVAPTVGPSELADTECVDGEQGNWQTYIAVDVPAYILKNSRALTGPNAQATAGLSMGGYCAQAAALRNPNAFGFFGNFSGATFPTYDPGMAALFGNVPNLTQTVNSYTSDWIVANQPASHTVRGWLLTASEDDPALISDQKAYVALAARENMAATFNTMPGAHTFFVWAAALQEWLPWALKQMDKPRAGLLDTPVP